MIRGSLQSKRSTSERSSSSPRLHKATKVICLENALTQRQATTAIKERLKEELEDFGNIVVVAADQKIDYQKMGRNEDNPKALRIFVQFERREDSALCKVKMNGHKFKDSKVEARFYNEQDYAAGIYTK